MWWKIWGDAKEPIFTGSEAGAKEKYKNLDPDIAATAYLEDPDGNEYVYNSYTDKFERESGG